MTWVDLEGTANTRDLAGLPAADGGRIRPNVLLRSDNLQDLTPADVDRLLDPIGLGTVLDLRTPTERRGTGSGPLAGRVRHIEVSLIPDREVPEPGAVLPDRWADGAVGAYLHYLSDRPEAMAEAVAAIAAPDAGAVLVHCAAGKDRTGVVVALVLAALGVPRSAIVEDFALSNERIEGVYRRLLGSAPYAQDVARIGLDAHRVDPYTMEAVLDVVDERWGGSVAYLAKAGFVDSGGLRSRLVEPLR